MNLSELIKMKIKKLLPLLILSIILISCSEDDDVTPTQVVVQNNNVKSLDSKMYGVWNSYLNDSTIYRTWSFSENGRYTVRSNPDVSNFNGYGEWWVQDTLLLTTYLNSNSFTPYTYEFVNSNSVKLKFNSNVEVLTK